MRKADQVGSWRFGELYNLNARHNAVVLLSIASMDVVSTYLCIKVGLYEANPVIRAFYNIGLPESFVPGGLVMHLLLYAAITYFVACAAKYLAERNRALAHTILIGYSALLLVVAFNNFLILTIFLLRA